MKSLLLLIFTFLGGSLFAQVGIGTTSPNANAVLELKSPGNNQGFLVPKVTTAQRAAIGLSSEENGMLVYDKDEDKFYYWQDVQWHPIRSGSDLQAGAGIAISGNTVSAIPDADGDPTNEIQDLQLNGNSLSITGNASAMTIDLAPFAGTNTDNQTLSFNGSTGNLAITGGNNVTLNATGSAGGVLSGTYPNPGLASSAGNSILTVLNNASTTSVLQANRLQASVVLETESPTGGAITGNFSAGLQVNDNAVTNSKILDAAVTTAKIADASVTTTKIADGAVTNAKIPDSGIQTTKIAGGSVGQVLTSGATGTVWADLPALSGGTVTSVSTGAGLTGGPITGAGTISVAANGITSTLLSSDATTDLNRAVTTNHIRDGAVTTQKLSNSGVTAATYGSSTQIPTFTVDAKGRITSASNVTFSGGGGGLAETLAASNDGKLYSAVNLSAVSINTVATPGALNVNGSHYVSFTIFADAYVIQPDDYIVIGAGSLKGGTVDLPPAAENRGRILIIRSTAPSLTEAVVVNAVDLIDGSQTSEPLYLDGNISSNVAYTITVISDGKTWWTIDRGIADNRFKG